MKPHPHLAPQWLRWTVISATTLLIAASTTLVSSSSAQAVSSPVRLVGTSTTVEVSAASTRVTTAIKVGVAAKSGTQATGQRPPGKGTDLIFTCTLQENYPHESGHNPGQVNVIGTATCDIPMATIDLVQNLYYNGRRWTYQYNYASPGGTYQVVQANADCLDGNWQGVMNWWLTWPAGIVPPIAHGDASSPVIPITC